MNYPGYIIWLKSVETGKEFPCFKLSGDTDMVTNGLIPFTSIKDHSIVIAELNAEEYNNYEQGVFACESRINAEMGRDDLRVIRILHIEHTKTKNTSSSFQFFLSNYAPPKIIYSDIYTTNGQAMQIREEEPKEFINAGGHIQWLRT